MAYNDDDHFTLANVPFGLASRPDLEPQAATRLHQYVYFIPELIALGKLEFPEHINSALRKVTPQWPW